MEILESLLGRDDRRNDFDFADLIKMFTRWIVGCGCIVVLGIVGLALWVISQGENAITVMVVVLTMIVAVVSLIRSSLDY